MLPWISDSRTTEGATLPPSREKQRTEMGHIQANPRQILPSREVVEHRAEPEGLLPFLAVLRERLGSFPETAPRPPCHTPARRKASELCRRPGPHRPAQGPVGARVRVSPSPALLQPTLTLSSARKSLLFRGATPGSRQGEEGEFFQDPGTASLRQRPRMGVWGVRGAGGHNRPTNVFCLLLR